MKDLFVPYELALSLKEKGFNEECLGGYVSNGLTYEVVTGNKYESLTNDDFDAPLYCQVIDWLRENYNIHIEIVFKNWSDFSNSFEYTCDLIYQSELLYFKKKTNKYTDKVKQHIRRDDNPYLYFTSYYEALTKAINEALKLI